MTQNAFFLVWNERGNQPMFKHDSFESAHREARRLAAQQPGDEFHVLMSVGTARTVNVEWQEHDTSEVPF